ncbi:MAG TPA: ABC transporter permease [Vicinamibacterales bacterium]|nr:ABC transporter permease [Vicinamibacterales bacterium]
MKTVSRLRAFFARLRFVPARRRLLDEMSNELDSHLELLTDRYVRSGMDPDDARLAARRQLGNTTRVREDIYTMNSIEWLGAVAHDLRYACRVLAKSPGFSGAAIATLALGIGATTAIFSVVYSVLFKPLPYTEPEQIYAAEIVVPERREQFPSLPASVQAYLTWRDARSDFSDMATLRPWECNLTGDVEPERVGGARVSANLFSFLGVSLASGRGFAADEEQPGNERVVVISDALWRRRYGADSTLVGRSISINGESHQVIGIAAPSVLVPTGTLLHPLVPFASRVDIWKPIAPTNRELKSESWDHGVLVRLATGGNLEAGRQQLEGIVNEMVRVQMPNLKTAVIVQLVPIREIYAGKVRLRLFMLLGASALLLLTACASLANLLLARVATRANEFATRLALGAGRARIVSLMVAEAAVVTVIGGTIGVALATYGASGLAAYGPEDVRLLATTRLNLPMLAFAIAASFVTALACSLYPAWRASRYDMAAALQEGGRTSFGGGRAGRSRRVLVGVEIALATALLASAGLLLHSFINVMQADRGYQIEDVLVADISLFGERYAKAPSRVEFYRELVSNVRALPGVLAAGTISDLPAVASSIGASRTILHPTDRIFQQVVLMRPVAMIRSVTSGYFAASGTALKAGRFLTDDEPEPVAVISESLARRLWPEESSASIVGRQFRQSNTDSPLVTVAGVVADARPGGMDREPLPVVYRPYDQWTSGPMALVVRTAHDSAALAPAVRSTIRAMDPNLPILAMRTMREIVSSTVGERQFQVMLTSVFAVLALLLGAVGLYGVVSYSVACSTRDIGLRMALGALRADVIRWVFSHGMRPVLVGLFAGLVGAVAVAIALRSLLFEVAPTDPLALGLVSLVLLLTSGLACYLPARRAARVDPVVALRS